MDREDAKATGARDYICKPFDIRELVKRVNAVLAQAQ
jgi:DNA-binding response OmpR family regulator